MTQSYPILTHYHQVPTSAAPYWPSTTKFQPVPSHTDSKKIYGCRDHDLIMLLLQIIFKQLVLWLPWDLIISLQRSRAMRCSSSPIWCLRFMERCRISPLHLRRQMSFDADNVLIRLISRVTLLWRRRERGKSLNCRRKRKWRASNWWFNQINIRSNWCYKGHV